jgi:phenylalanyl-tRNA synthetase alpha chain
VEEDNMLDQIQEVKERALVELAAIGDPDELDAWRIRHLGKKGALTQLLRGLGALPPEERPRAGQAANEAKRTLEAALEARRAALETARRAAALETERIDVSLPGRWPRVGTRHIISRTIREICDVFVAMGFNVVEGPEVEWDHYNFEMLNIPADHPARDMWDTMYIGEVGGSMLLRTHTSPVQARYMETHQPPIRVIVPGKCYRYEDVDATHEMMFYQIEGLAVDEDITLADLKGVLDTFAHALFGPERKTLFRCDYFPFVEPGVEMAIDCHMCHGAGCKLCSDTGWIEIMGAGVVHPSVLEGVGYDSSKYSGFAFGMGPERVAMLKHGIDDIRLFYANDLRFLRQFS